MDSLEGIERLVQALHEHSQTLSTANAGNAGPVDVFVEVDVGQGRCGVAPGAAAVPLCAAILAQPRWLRLAGLQAYHGGAQHLRAADARRAAIAAVADHVRHTLASLAAAGIAIPLVTGAGTGTLVHEARSGLYGELQPGSFLFMDADYQANEADPDQPTFEPALYVKTQVISRSTSHAVCDAGHKSHAIDSGLPRVAAVGATPPLRYANGGDEHGLLFAEGPDPCLPALGQCLWLIPGHCDPTVNLHSTLVGVRSGLVQGVVERLLRVDARGAIR